MDDKIDARLDRCCHATSAINLIGLPCLLFLATFILFKKQVKFPFYADNTGVYVMGCLPDCLCFAEILCRCSIDVRYGLIANRLNGSV
jgi:hypothetical protein